jgi:RNA chaperone Hfq
MDNLVGQAVTVYLINGIRLGGQIQQTDQYTILLGGAEGSPSQLVFKHAISTIQPAEIGVSHRWPPGRLGRGRQSERSFGQPVRDFGNTETEG